jgi:hypothetical protein
VLAITPPQIERGSAASTPSKVFLVWQLDVFLPRIAHPEQVAIGVGTVSQVIDSSACLVEDRV